MKDKILQLCHEIEKLPASEQQTKVSLMASELHNIYKSPEKLGSSGEYLRDTPPLMFVEDLRDIMFDGDKLTPDRLVADVVKLIENYLATQHSAHSTGLRCGECDSRIMDNGYCMMGHWRGKPLR
jgi:hypothetical protein